MPARLPFQRLRQVQGIHALYSSKRADHLTRLVALQVTDHMPAHLCRVKFRDFGQRILHAILAEIRHSQIIRYTHKLNGYRFRNGDERDILRVATCSIRGLRDSIAYIFKIIG